MRRTIPLLLSATTAAALLVVLLLSGCGASADAGSVHDVASLAVRLRAQGATVEMAGTIKHPFLAVPGQILSVNGSDIEVYQYTNAQALAADTRDIGPDGCIGTVGGGMLDPWTAPPHFFKSESLMVIYLGSDTKMLQLLTHVMGKQFAGK